MATITVLPSGYIESPGIATSPVYPASNGYSDIYSNTYALFSVSGYSTGCTYYTFNTSAIPQDAEIQSVTARAKVCFPNESILTYTICQLYSGTNPKGGNSPFGGQSSYNTVTIEDDVSWTRSELNDLRLMIGGTTQTAQSSSIYFYGAEVTITYSVGSSQDPSTGLDKITYVDGETKIYADNMNDIQDEIIRTANSMSSLLSDISDLSDRMDDLEIVGSEGTPVATKGTVTNHSISITPSVSNTKGYIDGGTHTGTKVVVSASDLTSGTLSIDENGTFDVTNYKYADVTMDNSTKQINFIDYDGSILHSYSSADWANVTSLPENPTHAGLIAQGWNWTKAQIDEQLTTMPNGDIWVGQMYATASGNTEIDISLDSEHLSPYLAIVVNGTVTVDWGDSSTADTITGTSTTALIYTLHEYTAAGNYTISIHVDDGTVFLRETSGTNGAILSTYGANSNRRSNLEYSSTIRSIRIGQNCDLVTYAFVNCTSLQSITIPSEVTSIGTYAFRHCYNLQSVVIPIGITSIEAYAFNGCSSLRSVSIPCNVTSIGNYSYQSCYVLESITIPNRVNSIGTLAFHDCSALRSIVIPDGVTSIGSQTFYNCHSLSSITIPNTVASIGSYAFSGCDLLQSVTIPHGVTSLGVYTFQNCYALQSVTLPDSITSIGNYAFMGCYSLQSITIPDGVTSVGSSTFSQCQSLRSITIPTSVTSIGTQAFNNCYSIEECHILSSTPPTLGQSAFTGIVAGTIIYVPQGSLATYQTATNWSTYKSYIQEE